MKLNSPEKNPIIRLILTLYIFIYAKKFQQWKLLIFLRISVIKIVYICNCVSHISDNFFCCSVTQWCPTLCDTMDCSMPGLPVPHHLLKFAQVNVHCVVIPSSSIILWHPLLLLCSVFPSIRDFSNVSAVHIGWPKYWSFSFSVSPLSEYSVLVSLKIDWFDLLAVQRTFRSLFQHYSSKASIFCYSGFFTIQLLQPYMTIWYIKQTELSPIE